MQVGGTAAAAAEEVVTPGRVCVVGGRSAASRREMFVKQQAGVRGLGRSMVLD